MKIFYLIFLLVLSAHAQLKSGGNLDVIKIGSAGISQGKIDSLVKQLALAQQAQAPGQNISPEAMTQLRWFVIDNFVGEELLKAEIKKQGLKADAKKVDSLAAIFKKQFPTDAIFKQKLKESGMSEADFTKKIENQLLAEQLLAAKIPAPKDPTDKEKKDYWEKNKNKAVINDSISGIKIVLNIAKGEGAQEIQNKKDVLKGYAAQARMVKASPMVIAEQFSMTAARISEDPNAKKDGGAMVRFLPKNQGAEFEKAVKNLKVGEVSEPFVQSGNKIMIFMLTEKNDGKFESYEHQIDYSLRLEAEAGRQLAVKNYLNQLAKTYKVQYLNKDYTPPEAIGM
ncbi:MAG: SurA N-terminal domain-containing protein [Fibromonadaceae bacterium]|jgi:hypothetical protein|nr:SurA N-terminal domain-containing protein [Fibromonadaceae bacterium]